MTAVGHAKQAALLQRASARARQIFLGVRTKFALSLGQHGLLPLLQQRLLAQSLLLVGLHTGTGLTGILLTCALAASDALSHASAIGRVDFAEGSKLNVPG